MLYEEGSNKEIRDRCVICQEQRMVTPKCMWQMMTLTAATKSGRMTLHMLMFLAGWKLAAISIAAS